MNEIKRCGQVAIVGRPNVGKSTLLNHLLGQKLAITSRRPQTTRHTLLGIHTQGSVQMLFVDTPGIHSRGTNVMNRRMNRAALGTLHDVDVILFVVDRQHFDAEDEAVLAHIAGLAGEDSDAGAGAGAPTVIAVINKVDRLDRPDDALPVIAALAERYPFHAIVPLSALRERNLDRLLEVIAEQLPAGEHLFAEDEITDRPLRFLVAEIIREKLMRQLGDELPYQSAVVLETWNDAPDATRIQAQILVEKASQRAIVIGRGGSRLRDLGRDARLDIERLLERRVHLSLWVKVRQGWADNARLLAELGHDDELE